MKVHPKSKNEYPAALDHFGFADVPWLEEVFGKNCRSIHPIRIPADDRDIYFPQELKAYRKSGLFCKSKDGVTATRVRDEKDDQGEAFLKERGLQVQVGEMYDLPCPDEMCPYYQNDYCQGVGRFLFLIPTAPRLGVYEISTKSINAMKQINDYLAMVDSLINPEKTSPRRICRVPFELKLVLNETTYQGKKKKNWIINLEFSGALADLEKYMVDPKGLPSGEVAIDPDDDPQPDDLFPKKAHVEEDPGKTVEATAEVIPPKKTVRKKPPATKAAPEEPPTPTDEDAPKGQSTFVDF
jgi:hypothetical protein